MRSYLIALLCATAALADVPSNFKLNGIVYDEIGEGRILYSNQQCDDLSFNFHTNWVSRLSISEVLEPVLERKFQRTFHHVCSQFDVPSVTTYEHKTAADEVDAHLNRMSAFELNYYDHQFRRDLLSVMVDHKVPAAFYKLINKEFYTLRNTTDREFHYRSTVFPTFCDEKQMIMQMKICTNITNAEYTGTIYAIAHSGRFVEDKKAFAYFDLPAHVLVGPSGVTPIDIKQCKILFGNMVYCFSTKTSSCHADTLEGCQILARRVDTEPTFYLNRTVGNKNVIATNAETYDIYSNSTDIEVPYPIFVFERIFNGNTTDATLKSLPTIENQFPPMTAETRDVLSGQFIPLYKDSRKGQTYLTYKTGKSSVWDGFKSFFNL